MTGAQLRKLLAGHGLTRVALADKLGVDARTVRRWLAGTTPIPRAAEIAILSIIGRPRKGKAK
jgi:transcriptional regulator with XRE-family HTH domain